MALPESAYRDPSKLCDTLRRLDKKLGGCDGCVNRIVMLGLEGCVVGGKVDGDGYCEKRKAR